MTSHLINSYCAQCIVQNMKYIFTFSEISQQIIHDIPILKPEGLKVASIIHPVQQFN